MTIPTASLLSLITHEMRAPLGVVRGYLRLIEQQGTGLTEMQRRAVSAALTASDKATDVLAQVSALAQLESGEVVPALTPTPLRRLLEGVVGALVVPAEPKVTVQLGEVPDVSVPADEPLLRAALAGLVGAVIRAQAANTRIDVLARADEDGVSRGVTIVVTGMEQAGRAAEERPLNLLRGGSGLDLPIAVFTIGAHHGSVRERRANERFAGVVVWLPSA
jgi:signal transduction histidine kinase